MAARARRRLASLSAHVGCNPARAGGENGARRQHNPGGTPMKLSSKEWQNRVLNLHELVPLARQSLEAGTWSYLRGGSDSAPATLDVRRMLRSASCSALLSGWLAVHYFRALDSLVRLPGWAWGWIGERSLRTVRGERAIGDTRDRRRAGCLGGGDWIGHFVLSRRDRYCLLYFPW